MVITDDGRYFVEQDEVSQDALLDAIIQIKGDRPTLLLRADESATIKQMAAVANVGKALNMGISMATERGRR